MSVKRRQGTREPGAALIRGQAKRIAACLQRRTPVEQRLSARRPAIERKRAQHRVDAQQVARSQDRDMSHPGKGQIFSIRELLAVIVNVGNPPEELAARSPPSLELLARIVEASVSVGASWSGGEDHDDAACASLGRRIVADRRVVDFHGDVAAYHASRRLSPATTLPEIVELMIFAFIVSARQLQVSGGVERAPSRRLASGRNPSHPRGSCRRSPSARPEVISCRCGGRRCDRSALPAEKPAG